MLNFLRTKHRLISRSFIPTIRARFSSKDPSNQNQKDDANLKDGVSKDGQAPMDDLKRPNYDSKKASSEQSDSQSESQKIQKEIAEKIDKLLEGLPDQARKRIKAAKKGSRRRRSHS